MGVHMSDFSYSTTIETAAAVAAGEVSSRELLEAALARVERLDGPINAVVALDAERALEAADRADEAVSRGGELGPLHGVPLAHKDMFYRAGRISGCGSKIRADFVPDATSTVLERLDRAGALDIARLNMVEFALGVTGHNEVVPTPKNPWNTAHITGGSSSGPGAAVAARLVFGTLGSDTGGSIRFPSCCNGLIGIKPTWGRVSRYGAMPLSPSLDTIGPLTRTVDDWELHLAVNHLGPASLTSGLHWALTAVDGARVVTVTSAAHRDAAFDPEDPHFSDERYDGHLAHARSRSAALLHAALAPAVREVKPRLEALVEEFLGMLM